jgi:N-succinyldiaminopimelate aminotransferase
VPQVPLPVLHAYTKLLADEAHVEANRALYSEIFEAAGRILQGGLGYRRRKGGFSCGSTSANLAAAKRP